MVHQDNSAACQIFTRKTLLIEWPFRFVNLLIVRNMFRLSMHNLCGMMHMIFVRQLPDRCVQRQPSLSAFSCSLICDKDLDSTHHYPLRRHSGILLYRHCLTRHKPSYGSSASSLYQGHPGNPLPVLRHMSADTVCCQVFMACDPPPTWNMTIGIALAFHNSVPPLSAPSYSVPNCLYAYSVLCWSGFLPGKHHKST